jgi:Trypsin-like peptidase domain/Tetratricopeptide repeat
MQPAVAQITSPSIGTAFAINARTALTAWHCVTVPGDPSTRVDEVPLRFFGGEETSAKVGDGDPDQDWTVLELATPLPASLRPLQLVADIEPGTACRCLGFPRATAQVGYWPVLATVAGETEGPDRQPLIAIQAELESGMDVRGLSGGPVVPRGRSVEEAAGLVVRRLIEPEEGKPMSSFLVACPARLFAAAAPGVTPTTAAGQESTREALAAAAQAGDVSAAARLGNLLLAEGKREQAEPWLRQAGLAGEPTAAFAVGMLIDARGDLVKTDRDRAEEALVWFRRGATGGDVYGTTTMGIRLRQHGRSDAALPWLEEGVERGDPMAAHTLARIYEERGRTDDALRWERFSAEQGDVRAAYDLGRMLNARGERDEAIRWLRRATIDPDAVGLLRELGVEPGGA